MAPTYDVSDVSSVSQTPYGILRIMGGWGNVNGPGLLMLRCMISGTTTAALLGISFAVVGSTIWGTAALPFLYGSTMGYGLGSWRWYHNSIIEAERSLIQYPQLIRLHMLANFPWQRMLDNRDVSWYNSANFRKNWVMESMLVASWLSAKPALDEIYAKRELKLVEAYGDADVKGDA